MNLMVGAGHLGLGEGQFLHLVFAAGPSLCHPRLLPTRDV